MKGTWNFRLEKPLNIQIFMDCFVEAEKKRILIQMQNLESWTVKLQKEVDSQLKILLRLLLSLN